MKKIVLLSLLSMYGVSLLGMTGFVPHAELDDFLKKGDAEKLVQDLGGTEKTLEHLKKWAGGFFEDFGIYHRGDKVTVLQKFSDVDVPDLASIDFLLNECDSDPDFGPNKATPRELAETRHLNNLLILFNRKSFSVLFEDWVQGHAKLEAITDYFEKHADARVDIDFCWRADKRSIRAHLEEMKTDEAKKILVYAALSCADKMRALRDLVVGCIELPDVSSDVLKKFLGSTLNLEFDNARIDVLFEKGLEDYLLGKIKDEGCKPRALVVYELLEEYIYALPSDVRRHSFFWIKADHKNDTDANLSDLLVHCAQKVARLRELKECLNTRENVLNLNALQYDLMNTLEDIFVGLDDTDYPHKATVMQLLHEHNGRILLEDAMIDASKIQEFVDYIQLHPLTIDTLMYEDAKSIAVFLQERLPHVHDKVKGNIHTIYERLKYRSNPPEADQLRRLITDVVDGTTPLADLEAFLVGKSLNIDCIVCEPGSDETLGTTLEVLTPKAASAVAQDIRVAQILSLDGIRLHRSLPTSVQARLYQLIGNALANGANYNELETFYQDHVTDVDSLCDYQHVIANLTQLPLNPNARAIAKLVQPARTKKDAMLVALYKEYEADSAKLAELKDWVTKFPRDIDQVTYDTTQPASATNTIGYKVNLQKEPAVLELFKNRSNPVEADQLRILMSEVIAGTKPLKDLETFLQGKCFNIDLIVDAPTTRKTETIGQELDANKATHVHAARILALDGIRLNRSVPTPVNDRLYQLIVNARADGSKYNDLEVFYKANVIDVDTLFDYERVIADLTQLPLDPNARAIAKLVQPNRTKKDAMLLALYKDYEAKADPVKLAELKAWIADFPRDIDQVTYDPAQPVSDANTIGHKVNLQKDVAMLDLFKATRTKVPLDVKTPPTNEPDPVKKSTSLITRNRVALALGAAALSYLIINRNTPSHERDMHQIASVDA